MASSALQRAGKGRASTGKTARHGGQAGQHQHLQAAAASRSGKLRCLCCIMWHTLPPFSLHAGAVHQQADGLLAHAELRRRRVAGASCTHILLLICICARLPAAGILAPMLPSIAAMLHRLRFRLLWRRRRVGLPCPLASAAPACQRGSASPAAACCCRYCCCCCRCCHRPAAPAVPGRGGRRTSRVLLGSGRLNALHGVMTAAGS